MQNRQLFRNREVTELDLLTNQNKQVNPVLETIHWGLRRYLAEINDLFLYCINRSHDKNTVLGYHKVFIRLQQIKKAELS